MYCIFTRLKCYPNRLGLESVFDEVILVDVMDSEDRLHLSLMGRPELGITFTKIHCWTLTQYSKCVFLDADTLVSQLNIESQVKATCL